MQKVGFEPTRPLQTDVSKTPLSTSSITSAVVLPKVNYRVVETLVWQGAIPYMDYKEPNLCSTVSPLRISELTFSLDRTLTVILVRGFEPLLPTSLRQALQETSGALTITMLTSTLLFYAVRILVVRTDSTFKKGGSSLFFWWELTNSLYVRHSQTTYLHCYLVSHVL